MQSGQPSRTAFGAAAHRAAHQVLEHGSIFADELALRIIGADAEVAVQRDPPSGRRLRLFIAARTRFAEDALAVAVARGARQLVVLGAGLDTTAYRSAFDERLRIFEVDHPATQEWKRRRLADAGIPLPRALTFAPVDFERETLGEGLRAAGFDPVRRTFFSWLGVVPYLTEPAIFATLGVIARLPGGADVVFDYANPPAAVAAPEDRAALKALAERVAALGEAIKSYFETDALCARLRALGFREVEDLGPAQIAARYFPDAVGSARGGGGHIVRATTV